LGIPSFAQRLHFLVVKVSRFEMSSDGLKPTFSQLDLAKAARFATPQNFPGNMIRRGDNSGSNGP